MKTKKARSKSKYLSREQPSNLAIFTDNIPFITTENQLIPHTILE